MAIGNERDELCSMLLLQIKTTKLLLLDSLLQETWVASNAPYIPLKRDDLTGKYCS